MAVMHAYGHGGAPQNNELARHYFERAAALDFAPAKNGLAMLLSNSGGEKELQEAFKLFNDGIRYVAVPINQKEGVKLSGTDPVKVMNEIKVQTIIRTLENLFGPINVWAVNNRRRDVVIARSLFFWAVRGSTTHTIVSIGELLPVKFHYATVIYAKNQIDQAIQMNDPIVMDRLEVIAAAVAQVGDKRLLKNISIIQGKNSIAHARRLMRENRELLQ